jgi:dTDP-4-amino-4,6-dideoxygalactose transaminase
MTSFINLNQEYKEHKQEFDAAIASVLDSGSFILGKNVSVFEERFASYCEKKYGVGVASGTEALHIALKAYGIGKGDEVITVPNTAVPTVAAIEMANAKPVLTDINYENLLMDPENVKTAITDDTKAIIPVHLYGNVCNMAKIRKIAQKHGIKIIEDCCQSHGAEYDGKKVPVSGTGCFSFYPSKNLGAFGDAGMIVTENPKIFRKAKMLRCYGESRRYKSDIPGFNSRLDEIQAAILNVKLDYLDKNTDKRRELAALYNASLKRSNLVLPKDNQSSRHVYHLYVIRTKARDQLKQNLEKKGIQTLIHYPIPIHLQKAYKHFGYKRGDFPIAEKASQEILSLPIYPQLAKEDIQKVCNEIKAYIS